MKFPREGINLTYLVAGKLKKARNSGNRKNRIHQIDLVEIKSRAENNIEA
jgi:hypothetical protein